VIANAVKNESFKTKFRWTLLSFKKITKSSSRALLEHVDRRAAEIQAEKAMNEPATEEYPEDIKRDGNNILKNGKVLKFLLQQYHKNHIGDDVAAHENERSQAKKNHG
jgi:ribosomal protein S3AE